MFSAVEKHLGNGGCLGIFPEGGSTDKSTILPLKAGVCIMAFGTMENYKNKVKIICCGLNYYQSWKFRSNVIVDISEPIEIS